MYDVKIITRNLSSSRRPRREETRSFDTADAAQEWLYITASQYTPCEWVCGYIYNRTHTRKIEALTAQDLIHYGKTYPYTVRLATASGLNLTYHNVQAHNPAEAISSMRSWWQQYHEDDRIKRIEVKRDERLHDSRDYLNP